MDGQRGYIKADDGARIGTLTAGSGPPLLLVHGGMGRIERWLPVWETLGWHFRVTAMDRRGRGSSTDGPVYSSDRESADVSAVISGLHSRDGALVNVFAHSIGATFALKAVAGNPPVARVVLYEPPGPETVADGWSQKVTDLIQRGQVGPAIATFLTDVIGLSHAEVENLRGQAGSFDPRPIAAATLPREAHALDTIDLAAAERISVPVLLLLGSQSPPWAAHITAYLQATIADASTTVLDGLGHEGIDNAPDRIASLVTHFLDR